MKPRWYEPTATTTPRFTEHAAQTLRRAFLGVFDYPLTAVVEIDDYTRTIPDLLGHWDAQPNRLRWTADPFTVASDGARGRLHTITLYDPDWRPLIIHDVRPAVPVGPRDRIPVTGIACELTLPVAP
jgi:hypothetical protein